MPAVIPEGLVNRLNNILVAQDNSHLAVSTKVINTNIVKDARIKLTFLGELPLTGMLSATIITIQKILQAGRIRIPT